MEVPHDVVWNDFVSMPMDRSSERQALWDALGLAWEMGYTIAVPLILFALGGRFLDRWIGTAPWLMLIGIGVAIAISSIAITRKIRSVCRVEFTEDSQPGDRPKMGRSNRSSL